jgi:H+/Cl- antiporter ClcA
MTPEERRDIVLLGVAAGIAACLGVMIVAIMFGVGRP